VVLQLSTRLRIRLASALLVAVMVWPSVHFLLVRSYQLDPWAFFGFAMYSVPNLRVNVRAAGLETPDPNAAPDWNAIPISSYPLLNDFAAARSRWGRLLPPDDLARKLFEKHSHLPALLIRVRRWHIAPESALLEPIDSDYFFYSGDPAANLEQPRLAEPLRGS
jgi:hypothetical protein